MINICPNPLTYPSFIRRIKWHAVPSSEKAWQRKQLSAHQGNSCEAASQQQEDEDVQPPGRSQNTSPQTSECPAVKNHRATQQILDLKI